MVSVCYLQSPLVYIRFGLMAKISWDITHAVPLGSKYMLFIKSFRTNPIYCPLATTAVITTLINTELYKERQNWLKRTCHWHRTATPNPKPDNLSRQYTCDTNYKPDNDYATTPSITTWSAFWAQVPPNNCANTPAIYKPDNLSRRYACDTTLRLVYERLYRHPSSSY